MPQAANCTNLCLATGRVTSDVHSAVSSTDTDVGILLIDAVDVQLRNPLSGALLDGDAVNFVVELDAIESSTEYEAQVFRVYVFCCCNAPTAIAGQ